MREHGKCRLSYISSQDTWTLSNFEGALISQSLCKLIVFLYMFLKFMDGTAGCVAASHLQGSSLSSEY